MPYTIHLANAKIRDNEGNFHQIDAFSDHALQKLSDAENQIDQKIATIDDMIANLPDMSVYNNVTENINNLLEINDIDLIAFNPEFPYVGMYIDDFGIIPVLDANANNKKYCASNLIELKQSTKNIMIIRNKNQSYQLSCAFYDKDYNDILPSINAISQRRTIFTASDNSQVYIYNNIENAKYIRLYVDILSFNGDLAILFTDKYTSINIPNNNIIINTLNYLKKNKEIHSPIKELNFVMPSDLISLDPKFSYINKSFNEDGEIIDDENNIYCVSEFVEINLSQKILQIIRQDGYELIYCYYDENYNFIENSKITITQDAEQLSPTYSNITPIQHANYMRFCIKKENINKKLIIRYLHFTNPQTGTTNKTTGDLSKVLINYLQKALYLQKFQHKNITKEYVTPEDFGAIGDGIHDDTYAFKLMLNTKPKKVVLTNIYLISQIKLPENIHISGGTIKINYYAKDYATVTYKTKYSNYDAYPKIMPSSGIQLNSNIQLDNIKFIDNTTDFLGTTYTRILGTKQKYPDNNRVFDNNNICTNISITNCDFTNIHFGTCIFIQRSSNIIINNNKINGYEWSGIQLMDGCENVDIFYNIIKNGHYRGGNHRYPICVSAYNKYNSPQAIKIRCNYNQIIEDDENMTEWQAIDGHGCAIAEFNYNIIKGTLSGIHISSPTDPEVIDPPVYNIEVIGNDIELGTMLNKFGEGIIFSNPEVSNINISNNKIKSYHLKDTTGLTPEEASTISTQYVAGIEVGSTEKFIKNIIINNNSIDTNTAGIRIATKNKVINNTPVYPEIYQVNIHNNILSNQTLRPAITFAFNQNNIINNIFIRDNIFFGINQQNLKTIAILGSEYSDDSQQMINIQKSIVCFGNKFINVYKEYSNTSSLIIEDYTTEILSLKNMLAPVFDSTQAYEIGDFVMHSQIDTSSHGLYKFITPHTANTDWNEEQVAVTNLAEIIKTLKQSINNL